MLAASTAVSVAAELTASILDPGVIPTKSSDVQDADEVGGGVERETLVNSGHHVVEQTAVHGLGQRVTSVVGLLHLQRDSGEAQTCRFS